MIIANKYLEYEKQKSHKCYYTLLSNLDTLQNVDTFIHIFVNYK